MCRGSVFQTCRAFACHPKRVTIHDIAVTGKVSEYRFRFLMTKGGMGNPCAIRRTGHMGQMLFYRHYFWGYLLLTGNRTVERKPARLSGQADGECASRAHTTLHGDRTPVDGGNMLHNG